MRRKRILHIIILGLFLMAGPFAFSGCVGGRSVSDALFVESFGIERGETFRYRVVVLCMVPKGGEDAAPSSAVYAAEGRTPFEAIETLNASLPLPLSFSRVSMLLLSVPLLTEGRLSELTDVSLGRLDIGSGVRVLAAEGELSALYEGRQSDADPSFSKIPDRLARRAEEDGTVPDTAWAAVQEAIRAETFDLALPLIGVNEPEPAPDAVGVEAYPMQGGRLVQSDALAVSAIGCAVFDGPRMVGTLSGRHTQLLAMANGTFRRGRMDVALGDGTLTLTLRRRRATRVTLNDTSASVEVFLDADLDRPAGVEEERSKTERAIEAALTAQLNALGTTLQSLGSDAIGLGRYDRMRFPFGGGGNFRDRYPTLALSFSVSVRLRAGGAA